MLLLWLVIFAVALSVLIKSADIFTTNSEKLGKILGVPQFIIGVSIVALGTSFPELMTSLLAAARGYSSVVAADVVGSNIANILLVGGLTAVFARRIIVEKSLIHLDLPILVAITALLIVTIYDGSFSFVEGILMLLSYLVYIVYNWSEHKQSMLKKIGEKIGLKQQAKKRKVGFKLIALLIGSGIGIYFGADYTIKSIIELSSILNLAPAAIAISAVAIGTSLPELLVSIKSARNKNYEMVMGNIIGSCILNATIVMAIPSFIVSKPLNVTSEVITIAVPFLIIATLLLTFSGVERKLYSFEGALYGLLYFVFIGQLFHFL